MSCWLGVDVGGPRKGFDVAVLDESRLLCLRGGKGKLDQAGVREIAERFRPLVVAIDSPRSCARPGEKTRDGELELNRKVCGIRWTPDERRVRGGNPYYSWIVEGLGPYEALASSGPALQHRALTRRYRSRMDLSLFFAGTGGSVPSARRGLPSILLRCGGDRILFDCGEGTQRQLLRSVGLIDMEAVFITHFHADHWLGLPGMLKSFALRDREAPLAVYGPRGLGELMSAMRNVIFGRLPYDLKISELAPGQAVEREGYAIHAVPVSHRSAAAFGYAIVEEPRPGHLDAKLAEQLGVTPGPDFGRLQRGETVNGVRPEQVMGPEREGRKLVLSGDTGPCEALKIAAHQADLLVHEATFSEEESDRARQTAHSTARQAAELAREAEVRMLALTHISTRYAGGQLRDEARAIFPDTEAPRDFDTIEVPFPERGTARLERWSERQARERAAGLPGETDEGGADRAPAPAAGRAQSAAETVASA